MLPPLWSELHQHTFTTALPDHCTPTSPILVWISSTFNTCIPTPLALISTTFGILSIASWFCAQLPQLYKNYRIKSTSGLSPFFLIEWCLGDASMLAGALLTNQATWQVCLGLYYCFVDFSLVGQWIWYQKLKHGRPVRQFWKRKKNEVPKDMAQTVEGLGASSLQDNTSSESASDKPLPKDIVPPSRGISFHTPNYGSFQSTKERWFSSAGISNTPSTPSRHIQRVQAQNNGLPSPSPKTVLFITLLIALAQASPLPAAPQTSPYSHHLSIVTNDVLPPASPPVSLSYRIGTALAWLSTLLYLISRLPQLLKNHSRRSTAGLSLTLFLAAFCGNTFYSLSMLTNPILWAPNAITPAHGLNGWIGADGRDRTEWITGALPFFMGAAGVLGLDAAVALQFWWFRVEAATSCTVAGDAAHMGREDIGEEVLVVSTDDMGGKWKWIEVTGWMRGWKPSVSLAHSPSAGLSNSLTPDVMSNSNTLVCGGDESGLGFTRRGEERTALLDG